MGEWEIGALHSPNLFNLLIPFSPSPLITKDFNVTFPHRVGQQGRAWGLATVFVLLLMACTAAPPTAAPPAAVTATVTPAISPTPLPLELLPIVESAAVLVSASGIQGVAQGQLPSPCYTLQPPTATRQGNTFTVELRATRPATAACPATPQPFTADFTLDPTDMPDGFYAVQVNQQAQTSFTFQTFMLAAEQEPANTIVVEGVVWHDVCVVRPGETAEPVPAGCTATAGGIRANGRLDPAEAGLSEVVVNLGVGQCPAPAVLQTITDANGRFAFEALAKGSYCVFVDAESGSNQLWLTPGVWSTEAAVTLNASNRNVLFGWDYDLLPRPSTITACEDKALFTADPAYTDGREVSAGSTITQTWRVQNVGTCTWTTAYKLVRVGSGAEETESQSLLEPIVPGAEVALSVTIPLPNRTGTYEAEWLLYNEAGQSFGLGIAIQRPFGLNVRLR